MKPKKAAEMGVRSVARMAAAAVLGAMAITPAAADSKDKCGIFEYARTTIDLYDENGRPQKRAAVTKLPQASKLCLSDVDPCKEMIEIEQSGDTFYAPYNMFLFEGRVCTDIAQVPGNPGDSRTSVTLGSGAKGECYDPLEDLVCKDK